MRLFQLAQNWFGYFICPNIYNIPRMQFWLKLVQFAQMVLIIPKFEWSYFNYPNMIEAVGFCPNFLTACKFKWSGCILAKLKWSCLKLPKIEWGCYTWPEFEWSYCHLAQSWFSLLEFTQIFQFMETFVTSSKTFLTSSILEE